ncbi:hypothetical protein [Novipirellula galeiformis]|uniref:hypothetical protein n=1 Tax=Novipirellula galeiformis TaxID=2528004 RepID=UPI0018CD9917|nr:hypothetical protein [Novipirellula galeiformis]
MSSERELVSNVTRRSFDTYDVTPPVTNRAEGQTDIARSIPMLDIARSIVARTRAW